MTWPRVLVAGGSIGGLTTALLLRDLGCDVEVFERSAAALEERGTGIVVLPVTERYFTENPRPGDVEEPRVSLGLTYWTYVDEAGKVLSAEPDNYRFSGWNTLYRALLDRFDPARYHLDAEMVGFDRRRDGVTLALRGGRRVEGDLLVCADGIASTARRILLPGVAPVYAGYVAWRGVTDESALSPETRQLVRDAMVYQVLDDGHILVYAIPGATPGTRVINSVWYRNYPDDGRFAALMTGVDGVGRTATMPPGTIRPEFVAEMQAAADATLSPAVREIVLKCTDPMIQAIFDLESPRMAFGRVCLLGDAAFGLRPHVAAGQAKACADAWALHDALAETAGDVDGALAVWEPRQLEVGRAALARSRRMGVRSQVEATMVPGDADWKFGLYGAGD